MADSTTDKQLVRAKVTCTELPTGASFTLKYKIDDTPATAWTTIGTYSTVGGLGRSFVNIESSGVDFASGTEYKFQILSTGGCEITGFEVLLASYFTP